VTTLSSSRPEETRVGVYRLLAPIGEGGMGVVHLAQGPDGKRVALKVLRPHIVGDTEARERLAREVSSLQRISSPRIAEILDADPDGPVPFVVTRYVPGLSLYHYVAEEGTIAGNDLLHFADALAEALQAVHSVGVLHRDIKPTNVLMEGRSPVLIDFGLARVAEDPRLTQTGWLLGTPGYLAPEILYGDDATVASDVHAWAATVVFAATGRPPYGTGPSMAIMDRVRRGQHDLAAVPELLVGLLRECLSPEPLERPTVRELRSWIHDQRQTAHLAAQAAPEPELWTMPLSPQASAQAPVDATPDTDQLPPATPAAQPTTPRSESVRDPARVVAQPYPLSTKGDSRAQQVLQLLGLGALTSALVAYAPYAGTAVVATLVLLLRTASVTRQRHGRRRVIRGRPRWYDVSKTTVSTPGYLLLAFSGALTAVAAASLTALAMFSLGYLLGQPADISMLMAGLGFTPALWWGPGSGRLREVTRGMVSRTARSEFGGWFVIAMSVLGTAVLLGLLLTVGPNWAPALSAPWR
jgi:serine/threonine protein kinase